MNYINLFSKWLSTTPLCDTVAASRWIVPASQVLHFFGLALLFGMAGMLDSRMLGLGKGIAIGEFSQRMITWAGVGFVLNAITGFIMFAGAPNMFYRHRAFGFK